METPSLVANPFALMLYPEAVLRAVEQSERLPALRRRVCRPLDKTQTTVSDEAAPSSDVEADAAAATEPEIE